MTESLITQHIDLWTSAIETKSTAGRGSKNKFDLYGIKKLRELILELAVRGKLVPQDPKDEPASVLLERIVAEKSQFINSKKIKKSVELPDIADEEKPFELPNGWMWTSLAEIAEINPRNNDIPDDIDVSFVPMPLISTDISGYHEAETRKWIEIKTGYTHFAEGDIAIAKITPCFENSKAVIFSNLKNGVGAGTTELHVARPYSVSINKRFILLCLKTPTFLKCGEYKMTGSAGQKRVPKEYFSSAIIGFPPELEQHRIVAKVDELMALCDQLEQQTLTSIDAHATLVETLLETLTNSADAAELEQNWARISEHFDTLFTTEQSIDALKQTILQLAVMGKLVRQDPTDEPASILINQIISRRNELIQNEGLKTVASTIVNTDEYLFYPPLGWSFFRLGNLAKFIDYRGKTPKKESSGIPLITAKNIKFGYINRDPEEYISTSDYDTWMTRGIPRVNDLLFTTEAPLGNVALVNIKNKFALAQRAICFQFHENKMSKYILYLMMSPMIQSVLADKQSGMTALGIKSSRLKEIVIPIPPLAEQLRIVHRVELLVNICDQIKNNIQLSRKTQLHLTDAIIEYGAEL